MVSEQDERGGYLRDRYGVAVPEGGGIREIWMVKR